MADPSIRETGSRTCEVRQSRRAELKASAGEIRRAESMATRDQSVASQKAKRFSRLSIGRRSDVRRAADTNHAMRAFGQLSIAEAANIPLPLLTSRAALRRKIREAGMKLVEFYFVS